MKDRVLRSAFRISGKESGGTHGPPSRSFRNGRRTGLRIRRTAVSPVVEAFRLMGGWGSGAPEFTLAEAAAQASRYDAGTRK